MQEACDEFSSKSVLFKLLKSEGFFLGWSSKRNQWLSYSCVTLLGDSSPDIRMDAFVPIFWGASCPPWAITEILRSQKDGRVYLRRLILIKMPPAARINCWRLIEIARGQITSVNKSGWTKTPPVDLGKLQQNMWKIPSKILVGLTIYIYIIVQCNPYTGLIIIHMKLGSCFFPLSTETTHGFGHQKQVEMCFFRASFRGDKGKPGLPVGKS